MTRCLSVLSFLRSVIRDSRIKNMSKKQRKSDASAKHVEKVKKSKNVVKPVYRNDRRTLPGCMYIRLDRRKLHESGSDVDLRDKLRLRDEYELNDLPCSDYERMHMT